MRNVIEKYKNMSLVAKATVWFFVCSIIQKGISLITTPIFTRLLSTEEFGLFTTYNSWLSIFTIFTTIKLNYGVFNKGMSKYSDYKDEYTVTMQSITTILTTIFAIFYFVFREWINQITELPTFIIMFMIVEMYFEPAISFWSLRQRYDFKYKSVIAITLLMAILNPVVGILAVITSNQPAIARIMTCIIIQIIFGFIIYILNCLKANKIFYKEYAKFAIVFNLPLLPHYLSEYILDQSDRIMIQKICSKADLGLYGVAYNAGMLMKIFISSLNSALLPWLYRKLEEKEFEVINKKIVSLLRVFIIPLLLFMLLAPELMKILAAPEYNSAVNVIPPITACLFFIFLFGIVGNVEFFYDKNKFTMYVSACSAILNLILNFIFIPLVGYVAAAYTTLVCYVVLTISHCVFVEKICYEVDGIKFLDQKSVWMDAFFLIIFTIITGIIYNYSILRYAVIIILFIIIFIKRKQIIETLEAITDKE